MNVFWLNQKLDRERENEWSNEKWCFCLRRFIVHKQAGDSIY